MILDSKEKAIIMNVPEGAAAIRRYEIDLEGIERGERYLTIPQGIKEIAAEAFASYNNGPVAANIRYMLLHPEDQIAEWSKKLVGKQLLRISFPPEAGKTRAERAAYLVGKELRLRLIRMTLPASLVEIDASSFPVLLEGIDVAKDHTHFQSVDGVLISADGKKLIRYPGFTGADCYRIPDTVEMLADGAFSDAFIPKLVIPGSVTAVGSQCFKNAVIGRLVFEEGFACIPDYAFEGCQVREIMLPATLRHIGNYAFAETEGLTSIDCSSESVTMGTGIFSRSKLKHVAWWPWQEIPCAAFMNSRLEEIVIPDGVRVIGDYAFAGCFRARRICLPESTEIFGVHSFDEGDMFSSDISLPRHLYHLIYRFPALSLINKKSKSEIWEQRKLKLSKDDLPVLDRQITALKKGLKQTKPWNLGRKRHLRSELQYAQSLLNGYAS